MFEFQKDSSQYVYHYTKAETALNYILKDKTLKFSLFNSTNDPKESKDWFFSAGTNENRGLTKYSSDYLSGIMNPRIKSTTHLLCFSKDKELSGQHLYDIQKRGFCKPRMWAQYGGNHTGVCLIFDFNTLSRIIVNSFSQKTWRADHVLYKDRLLTEIQTDPAFIVGIDQLEDWGEEEYAFSHSQQYAKRLFFEKAADWQNEDEYRWVVFDTSNEILLNYQNALKGIMFGEYCSEESIKDIVQITKSAGLKYQKLKWRNCTPWYDFGRQKWA